MLANTRQQERKSDKLSFRTFTIQPSCSGVAASWFMAPLDLRLLAGEVRDTSSRKLPNRQWTRRMVALTRDLHVFTSRVSADLSAVFFSTGYLAKTRYVRTLCRLLIRHYHPVLSNSHPPAPITEASYDS